MVQGNRMQGNRRKLLDLPEAKSILHYPLEKMLPKGECLAVNIEFGIIALFASSSPDHGHPVMKQATMIAANELALLLPILDSYPDYCPYEVLFAHLLYVNPSESRVEEVRERLHDAIREKAWDAEMRPVRNVMTRLRIRLRLMGLTVSSVLDSGYTLMLSSESHLKRARAS
jgi:hypothetical protein